MGGWRCSSNVSLNWSTRCSRVLPTASSPILQPIWYVLVWLCTWHRDQINQTMTSPFIPHPYFQQTVKSAFVVPNFTEHGFGLARCPQDLLTALQKGIRDGLKDKKLNAIGIRKSINQFTGRSTVVYWSTWFNSPGFRRFANIFGRLGRYGINTRSCIRVSSLQKSKPIGKNGGGKKKGHTSNNLVAILCQNIAYIPRFLLTNRPCTWIGFKRM